MLLYYMCTLELPKAVIKQFDKFRKNCLWRGSNVNGRGAPKAAWEMVCKTKEQGGLGVISLELQALLMKNLNKFFNNKDIPWVQLVWEKHYNHGSYHLLPNKDHFGGDTISSSCKPSRRWPQFKLKMVSHAFSGGKNGPHKHLNNSSLS